MYTDNLKSDIKTWLTISDDLDSVIELNIKISTQRVLSVTNRTKEEIEENEGLYNAILYDSIISFNKRYSEGKTSAGLSGLSDSFIQTELEMPLKQLLISLKKLKVID